MLWGTPTFYPESPTTPVSLHFNQAGYFIKDVSLIPIDLIDSRGSFNKQSQNITSFLALTEEMKHAPGTSDIYLLIAYQSLSRNFIQIFICNGFLFTYFFFTQPLRKVCIANRNIGQFWSLNNSVLYFVLFHFGQIRLWDKCAGYILYSISITYASLRSKEHDIILFSVLTTTDRPSFVFDWLAAFLFKQS